MTLLDTNVLLRWVLDDHPDLSKKARQLIEAAKRDELCISDVILAEVYYVLRGQQYSNRKIAELFENFMQQICFTFDDETRLTTQLEIISETMLDFADCYLIARAINAHASLQTFDKPMQKAYNKYKKATV